MMQRHYKSESGFDIRLEAKLKNDRLVAARESLGLSAHAAAENIGIGYHSLLMYEGLKLYPGPETQKKICSYYRKRDVFVVEEDVFPEELRHARAKKYVAMRTVPKEQLLSLSYIDQRLLPSAEPEAERDVEAFELTERINEALSSLTKREQDVLRRRFGLGDYDPHTTEQVSEATGIDRERLRQIEMKALRKLRHPLRAGKLRGY